MGLKYMDERHLTLLRQKFGKWEELYWRYMLLLEKEKGGLLRVGKRGRTDKLVPMRWY